MRQKNNKAQSKYPDNTFEPLAAVLEPSFVVALAMKVTFCKKLPFLKIFRYSFGRVIDRLCLDPEADIIITASSPIWSAGITGL